MVSYNSLQYETHDLSRFDADLYDYLYQNCSNPQKVRIFSAIEGRFVYKEMPCGHCWHCGQAKQAEQVTRLFNHRETWPFRYFVTLTYSPAYDLSNFDDKVRYDNMLLCMPTYDNDNVNGSFGYNPNLLCREHLQKFFKRLRKSVETEISYFACGEYGSHTHHQRPHYHIVLFSKYPLAESSIQNAWGLQFCQGKKGIEPYRNLKHQKNPFLVSFGRTDFVDLDSPRYLKKNSDGLASTSANVFKYVSKYVNKYEKNTFLAKKTEKNLRISKVFSNFAPEIIQKRYLYEKKCISKFDLFDDSPVDNLLTSKVPFSTLSFYTSFAPFALQSKQYAIGKEYVLSNLDNLSKGILQLSIPSGSARFPSYYQRKISEYLHPLRISYYTKGHKTLSLGNLPLLYKSLHDLAFSQDAQATLESYNCIGKSKRAYSKYLKKHYPLTTHLYDINAKRHLYLSAGYFNEIDNNNNFTGTRSFREVFSLFASGYKYLSKLHRVSESKKLSEQAALSKICEELPDFQTHYLKARDQLYDSLSTHQKDYTNKKIADGTLY